MLMEEESVCSSLPDITDSVLQQPQPDSWTSIDHQYINGEQQAIVWGETEVHTNQAHGTDQVNLSEEAEQWEQLIWPMTCTSAQLSVATVQWDMPDPSAGMSSLMTDSSSSYELDSGGVMSLDTTSPSLHQCQVVNAELFTRGDREEEDGFNSRFLNSNLEWNGSGSEPCDAADVQEPTTQEKEDSTHELLDSNNEIPLRTVSEEDEGHSAASDSVETVDLIDTLEEIEGSEDEVDSFVDLNPEEEQEEPGVLLTGQGDSEEEQTSVNGVETEEENEEGDEVEEEQIMTNESCTEECEEAKTVSCLCDGEIPAEPLQTYDTGPSINPDKLTDLQQSELSEERRCSGTEEDTEMLERLHEDPTGQTKEPEMCEDVDQNMDPEQSVAGDNDEEPSLQPADNAERIEDSEEILELSETLEETCCLEHQDCDQTTSQDAEPGCSESEQLEMTEESQQIQPEVSHQAEERHSEDQLGQSQHLEQSDQMELIEESTQPENADLPEESPQLEQTVCVEAEDPQVAEQQEQTEPSEQNEQPLQTADSPQPTLSEQIVRPEKTDEPEIAEQLSAETEITQQTAEAELNQVDKQAETYQAEEVGGSEDGSVQTVVANGEQPKPPETAVLHMNGGEVDREMACRLAERLYKLDGIQRVDVVKHLDKDNDFSHAVGEEYLRFFDFTGQTLDHALRSFLKVVVLIGETQERERVLQHFACRFHQCNPDSFSSSGSVLALTCALMLLNTDLHGQNVGKSMSSSKFVSNLDGMNEEGNFSKDLLKSLYNSIKSEPLEWAIDEEELKSSVLVDEDAADDAPLRSKANPFQDVPHDKTASVVKEGFLQRKLHADIDGKRTPWGKRSWKTFYGVLKGMVLYLQKNDYRRDQPTNEEVVSVHHSLAEQAADYTKKPHVFRLQTADWRVFLFQASSKVEMNSWISRINLVSALHSSPPFPAAVGSQRRFFRPILPASQSAHTPERQLQSHAGMLESFKADLAYLQQNLPEGKKAKAKELEEHRVRAEYLQHEMCRYEIYIQVLDAWKSTKKTGDSVLSFADLNLFDKAVCADSVGEEEEEEGGLKKSYSSPSLELEIAAPTVIKVRRNISERRTYRRTIIPRWVKEA
ncbi:PH and SEC7 domain-containing protein 4 [Siniperca chuatsi]|uniref:PH and SEC7 domain-containing protein 4 n=1 Tax=Siniperca chuatsi TaxID=119488 RepID=UPI001CE0EEE9|nr:PH and SEC7 domain-containing protein 4 [Siniperca chuatsi]XP_044029705.1 PH and SEC7 domain-containing protein 4 [Siniperca chuatsi]XP_044029706.1 PH and SEC7 domain-containing protein 4 [Siniperca chuatsi]XP_044029708.1 PH and SEC7 domain-containing protein 4 [Siniperca chuatsi]XP_044029709.1 PH and SEC7 domain-containing protein 4 [Siniperca chuatsi]XP_044029710.1 PH and SEC7 domain-containing protein 4 [Siniperca chuatsi]XP_044029711.1 PH and SEC7 domain-containing protein 4 [Siniperca